MRKTIVPGIRKPALINSALLELTPFFQPTSKYFLSIAILLFVQLPSNSTPYENLSEIHYSVTDRVFPGKGSQGDWLLSVQAQGKAVVFLKAKNYEEAIRATEQALKIYSYDSESYNLLAVILWQRRKPGDYELGVKNVRKAIELNPNKCIFWDNLAKALAGEEKLAEAQDAFIHASKCECTPKKLSEIQANIKHLNDPTANKITPGESVPRSTTMDP